MSKNILFHTAYNDVYGIKGNSVLLKDNTIPFSEIKKIEIIKDIEKVVDEFIIEVYILLYKNCPYPNSISEDIFYSEVECDYYSWDEDLENFYALLLEKGIKVEKFEIRHEEP